MSESRIYNLNEVVLEKIRGDLTTGVFGHSLIPSGFSSVKAVITEVAPNGEFPLHRDEYHHVFYVLSGTGTGQVGDNHYAMKQGTIVEIPAGTLHAYKNTSDEKLVLFTMNIPLIT